MNPFILTITNDEARPVLSMEIKPVEPDSAFLAIVAALRDLPRPLGQVRRKKRKDAGTHRNVTAMPATPPAA